MLAWTKQINTEGNADSRIIIGWSQSHATSNIYKYKSKRYEPQQKNRPGTVDNKLPGGGGLQITEIIKLQNFAKSLKGHLHLRHNL